MCYICGCSNFTIDDLVWYKYRCTQCGHVYESTGKTSICHVCRSRDVEEVSEKGSGKKHEKRSTTKTGKKRR